MKERAEMPLNIGADSLPKPPDLVSPDGPKTQNPNKTGVPYKFSRRAKLTKKYWRQPMGAFMSLVRWSATPS